MKQILILTLVFFALSTFGQTPQGLNYQAVARNPVGQPKQNTNISVKFTILKDSVNGIPVYTESHSSQTNAFGLFTLTIGQGMTSDTFSNIDWSNGFKFLKVEIDNILTGTTQLWSVPYALYSVRSKSSDDWISKGDSMLFTPKKVGIGGVNNGPPEAKLQIVNPEKPTTLLIGDYSDTTGLTFLRLSTTAYKNGHGEIQAVSATGHAWGDISLNPKGGNVGIGLTNPQTKLSVTEQASFGNRIFVGVNGTEDGYSLLHFKNGTSNHGGIVRASIGNGDGSDAPMLYQAKSHEFSGNVGIGISPTTKLHINGTGGEFSNNAVLLATHDGGNGKVVIGVYASAIFDAGVVDVMGSSGKTIAYISPAGGLNGDQRGAVSVYNNGGNPKAQMYVNENGLGVIVADIKNFAMQHPTQKDKEIWYACIEGPEAAAYERGTSQLLNGQAIVVLSEHFQEVMNSATMTVQALPLSADSKGLAIIEKNEKGFIIKELWNGNGNYKVDWEVKAVRKGYENYQPVRSKDESLLMLPSQSPTH